MDAQDSLLKLIGVTSLPPTAPPAHVPASPVAPSAVISLPMPDLAPAAPVAIPATPRTGGRPAARPRKAPAINTEAMSTGLYWVLEVLVAVGLLGIAGLLWYWDGSFTIAFLSTHWAAYGQSGLWTWSVPLFFTAVTLGAWPRKELRERAATLRAIWADTQRDADFLRFDGFRKELRVRWLIVTVVVIVNIGTSFSGLVPWLANRSIDLFTGWTIPTQGWGLYAPAAVSAIILAFGPEKVGRWASTQLTKLLNRY